MFGSKKFGTITLIVLCILFTPLLSYGQVSASSTFNDVSDSHWALPHIIKMELRGIIVGYGDGTFRPENSVSHMEAVTMAIRAMGLRKEAENAKDMTNAQVFNLPASWNADGYVTTAIKEGIVDSDNFQPDRNASRAWVAQVLIRMIGTEEEPDSLQTHFDDDASIPVWARKYAALAVEKGIIAGIMNKSGGYDFQPNGNVTRAQMATMISRLDRFMPEVEGQFPAAEVTSKTNNQLTLKHYDGSIKTYYVSTNAHIFSSSHNKVNLQNVAEENLIYYHTDQQGTITFIEILNKDHYLPVSVKEIKGTVVHHFADSRVITVEDREGRLITRTYSPDLEVDIREGYEVTLTLKEDIITGVKIGSKTETDVNEGIIFSLDTDRGILTLESNNRYYSYIIADKVEVEYQGVRFPTVNNLKKGDKIKVDLENGTVKSITLLTLLEEDASKGKIVAVSTKDNVLTIRTQDGRLTAYEVSSRADINIRGISSPSLVDLKVEDEIKFAVESNIITRIEVMNRGYESEVTGKVVAISTSSRFITIEDEQENFKTYKIDDYVYLDLDIRNPRLSDIYEGMLVTLKLDNNIVQEISLYNKFEGEIERIDRKQNIIIVKHDQGRNTCRLDDAVIRIIDIGRADIDDLRAGQKVLVTLEEDVVDMVEVITEKVTTVVEIDTYRERLEVKDGTSTRRYTAGSDTTYNIPGRLSSRFDDLNEGDVVHLRFVGTNLDEVTVIPPRCGVVLSVSQLQKRIDVKTDAGQEIITADDDLTVYSSSNNKMTPYNLKTNDYVKIVKTDEETILYQAKIVEGEFSSINTSDRRIYLQISGGRYYYYTISEDVAIWKNSTKYLPGDLKKGVNVVLYLFDDLVEGIRVK